MTPSIHSRAIARSPRVAMLQAAIAFAIATQAYAAPPPAETPDSTEAESLDTVEVRAARVERREQALRHAQHGGSKTEIGRERLAESNAVGTEDILRYAPNLTIRSRYIGDRNALIGGRSNSTIQGSRSLVYIDGLLISDLLGASFNPPRWGMVSPAEIQRVDVLYGPFTAELPGNSMGTTVQITTRYPRAFKLTGDAQAFSQAFEDDYGNDGDYRGNRINLTAGESHDRWRWFGAVSRLDTTSHPMQYATPSGFITTGVAGLPLVNGARTDRDPQGLPRVILGPTGIEDTTQYNAKFKLGVDLNEDATLEFVLGHWRNNYERHAESMLTNASGAPVYAGNYRLPDGRGIRIAANAFSPQSGEERHWQSAASLTWRLSDRWSLQAIASDYRIADNTLRSSTQTPVVARNGGAGTVSKGDGTGWNTLDAHIVGTLDSHDLRFGIHGDRYVLEQRVYANDDWRGGAETRRTSVFGGKARTLAAFAQDRWRFAEGWALDYGARYEQWSAYEGIRAVGINAPLRYPSRDLSAWSPNLGLRRELGDRWTLRASAGKATRFPTVSELFQGSISGNAIVNSDPNLKPEVSYSKEIALEGSLTGGNVRASLFEDDIRDSLFSQTNFSVFPTVTNIQNIGRIRNRGLEFAGDWNRLGIDGLSLSASLAFNRPRILDNPNFPASEGKHAPRIPKTRASAVLSYRPNEDWRVSLAGRYSGRQWNTLDNTDVNPDTFGGTSSFAVFDAKATRRIGGGFSLGVGIDNLGDERYFVFHPYPSRTFFVEIRYGEQTP